MKENNSIENVFKTFSETYINPYEIRGSTIMRTFNGVVFGFVSFSILFVLSFFNINLQFLSSYSVGAFLLAFLILTIFCVAFLLLLPALALILPIVLGVISVSALVFVIAGFLGYPEFLMSLVFIVVLYLSIHKFTKFRLLAQVTSNLTKNIEEQYAVRLTSSQITVLKSLIEDFSLEQTLQADIPSIDKAKKMKEHFKIPENFAFLKNTNSEYLPFFERFQNFIDSLKKN